MPDLNPETVTSEDLDLYQAAALRGDFAGQFTVEEVIVDLVASVRALTSKTEAQEAVIAAERPNGCWIAHYTDWSAFSVFGAEIDALRHAVEHSMKAQFVPWGEVR